jgi:hypothetical protein
MSDAIEAIKELRNTFADTATGTLKTLTEHIKELTASRLPAIEQEIRETKVVTKGLPSAETWATIASAANTDIEATSLKTKARVKQHEIKDNLRKKREPYQVILTTPNKETIAELNTMHAENIRQRCQNIIDLDGTPTAKLRLRGIAKITNGIRLDCTSPEDAQCLRQIIDWSKAFKDLAVHKPKHGIVVHGVHTAQVTGIEDTEIQKSTIQEWEESNGMKIDSIKKLRRKPRSDKPPLNCSIVVFTEDPYAADKCILSGFYIDSLHHKAEKYAPQLHITQCFNCFEYGHRASNCKRKKKCGKCTSEDHSTSECSSVEPHCCGCKGSHTAWAQHCPLRNAEGRRLMDLRMETSPFFTS